MPRLVIMLLTAAVAAAVVRSASEPQDDRARSQTTLSVAPSTMAKLGTVARRFVS